MKIGKKECRVSKKNRPQRRDCHVLLSTRPEILLSRRGGGGGKRGRRRKIFWATNRARKKRSQISSCGSVDEAAQKPGSEAMSSSVEKEKSDRMKGNTKGESLKRLGIKDSPIPYSATAADPDPSKTQLLMGECEGIWTGGGGEGTEKGSSKEGKEEGGYGKVRRATTTEQKKRQSVREYRRARSPTARRHTSSPAA